MAVVIPAILEKTWEEIQDKVKRIKPFTNLVQLDVMDGVFVPNQTFNNTSQISTLDIDLELHLMIDKPSLFVQQWALPNVKRIIFHYETGGNISHVVEQVKQVGKEVGIAINPSTSSYDIREHLSDIDLMLVMGVDPGFSGQSFNKDVLEKIKEIKRIQPELLIQVDGGVNEYTGRLMVEAGADILAAASYIWDADDIGEAIKKLQAL